MAAPESTLAPVAPAPLERVAGWLVVGLLAITLALYLVFPALAFQWLQRPFIGAFVEQTFVFNGVRSQSNAYWPLVEAGLHFPDRLVAVDGQQIRSEADLTALLARHQPGDTITVTAEIVMGRPGSVFEPGELRDIEVELQPFPVGDLAAFFAVPYFVGLVFLAAGVWVFRLRRTEIAGQAFAGFCAAVALLTGGLFDVYTTHRVPWAWTVGVPLTGALLFSLGLVFPKEARFVSRRPWTRFLSYAPFAVIAANSLLKLHATEPPQAYASAWLYGYIFAGLGVLFFVGMAVYRFRSAASPIVREQSRLILLGSLGFLPAVAWVVFDLFEPGLVPFRAGFFFTWLILFPIGVAYAILRYRLLSTDVLLARAMTYTLLLVLTAVGYGLLVAGLSILIGSRTPANNPTLIALLVFVLVVALNPLRAWLQSWVDRIFFRGRRAYRQRLTEFGHELTEAGELRAIVRALRANLQETVRPAHAHVFLADPVAGNYAAFAADGEPETDIQFEAQGALAKTLGARRQAVYLEPEAALPPELQAERARLAVLGSNVFVPLATKDTLLGWLALGPRLSGEPYRSDDVHFLESMADQASLAIERAQAVAALERRLNELSVLGQVSQAVNFTIAFDDLLELIYAQTSRVLDTANFHIILHEPGTNTLRYAFFIEEGERLSEREGETWPAGTGLASVIVRTGQTIRTDSYLDECARRGVIPLNRPYHAWLGVPLRATDRTLGALAVASLTPDRSFTAEHMQFFASIADQAAAALDKAELYRRMEMRALQLQTLNEIAQSLLTTLDLDTVLRRILDSAVDLLECEAGSLFLTEAETGDYVFRVTSGAGEALIGTRIPAGKGIVGAAATGGQPVIVDNAQEDPRWFEKADEQSGFVTRAAMAVPLGVGERNVGVIEVINKRDSSSFTEDDKALLMAFGGQAVVSIENARLYTLTDQALAARVEELSQMQRIDRELNAGLDINRVMSVALEQALEITGADAGMVGLVLEEGVQVLAAQGYPDEIEQWLLDAMLPLDKGLGGRVVETGRASLVKDVQSEPDYLEYVPGMQAQLTVPMQHEERTIGVIVLESKSPDVLTDVQLDFMSRLADHAAIAVTNARLYREVQEANLAKSEFVSFVSHELKTPMTSIKGYADLLAQGAVGPVTDMQAQFLDTIRSNVNRMSTLVSDLADIARIESGRMRLETTQFDFQIVVDDVVRSTQAAIDDKGQTLTLEVEPDLPPVWADLVRQVQVLTNLVSNAHKYTPEGGHIVLRVRRARNEWDPEGAPEVLHVAVQDSGIGIAPEDQAKIFGKFFRADHRYVREVPGTGLGLNIVKNLVGLQGGQAWFESELGAGSTFQFTVPLAEAVKTDPEAVPEAASVEA